MKKTIAIVANGEADEGVLKDIVQHNTIIGVDRAALWLIEHGTIPDIAIGDFDSVNKKEFAEIKKHVKNIQTFPVEKNFTDLELAIEHAVSVGYKDIELFGVLGKRADHTLAAYGQLELWDAKGIRVTITDATNRITIVTREKILHKSDTFQYFSIVPITEDVCVTLTGCAYPVNKLHIVRGQSIGVSNEIVGDSAVALIHTGKAFVVESADS